MKMKSLLCRDTEKTSGQQSGLRKSRSVLLGCHHLAFSSASEPELPSLRLASKGVTCKQVDARARQKHTQKSSPVVASCPGRQCSASSSTI